MVVVFAFQAKGQITEQKISTSHIVKAISLSANERHMLQAGKKSITWYNLKDQQNSKSQSFFIPGAIQDVVASQSDTVFALNGGNDIYGLVSGARSTVTFKGHKARVTTLSIDTTSNHLFSGSLDRSTILWDISERKVIKANYDHLGYVIGSAVNPVNGDLASCGSDGLLNLYNRNGELLSKRKVSDKWLWRVAFAKSGAIMSTVDDSLVYIWNKYSAFSQPTRVIKGIKGKTLSMEFSPDDRFLALTTHLQNIYLISMETGSVRMLKKIRKGPVTNIIFSPDGNFLFSSHFNLKGFYKWDINDLDIKPNTLNQNTKDKLPPQIYISSPSNIVDGHVVVYADMIKIEGNVVDESGVFGLTVNGTKTPVRQNGNFVITVLLSYQDTNITVECRDVNGNIGIRRFVVTRRDPDGSDYDPVKARNFLLVIGINDYLEWPHLRNAVRDANSIAGTLSGLYDFDFSDVTMLLDDEATRSNIYSTLRHYVEKIGPQDNFVIYFSGHGLFDPLLSEGYWVPVEAKLGSSGGDLLSNSDLLKIIKNINSQHTLIIADACFSGSLFNETSRGYIENVEKFRSRWALASGRLETVSDGGENSNSPFAKVLLEYLKTTSKEKISVSELAQFVKEKVPEVAGQTPIGNSLKNIGDEGGEFIFHKKK